MKMQEHTKPAGPSDSEGVPTAVGEEILLLKKHGLKVTRGRKDVLKLLMEHPGPLTIETLHTKLKKSINITTLYRMLEQFVSRGIVYQTDFRDGKAHFEFQEHHHHHIVCTSCGAKEDVPQCFDKAFSKIAHQSKSFASIESHMLEFFGICKKCQN